MLVHVRTSLKCLDRENNNKIDLLNGQRVNIMTDLLVDEDNIKSDSVQVKSVNYKDLK